MTVVHCTYNTYTVYIGRPSAFANRFTTKLSIYSIVRGKPVILVSSVKEAIRRYKEEAKSDDLLLQEIMKLPADAVLGCFCKPGPCHGDVIITLWNELHA